MSSIPAFLSGAAPAAWYFLVSSIVPDPYLDEVFHIPQAQAYCNGKFAHWDPKITTPPGLYLAVLPYARALGGCSVKVLRSFNVICLALIYLVLSSPGQGTRSGSWAGLPTLAALNTALFPPLFFFSGLFYTDIVSTLSVLLFLEVHNARVVAWSSKDWTTRVDLLRVALLVALGLFSLLCRQTNIFWVGIFPAIDSAFRLLGQHDEGTAGHDTLSLTDVVQRSWVSNEVYDPSVESADATDYFKAVLSVCLVSIQRLRVLLCAVAPNAMLLLLFCVFVLINGGVVLGDKANHVVTLHFPQMLYIWPYIMFFSWPLCIPVLYTSLTRKQFPSIWPMILFSAFAISAVHFNTVVHPFTLADNRHYVFYVFQILRRHVAIKYLAVPIYVLGSWLALRALGGYSSSEPAAMQDCQKRASGKTETLKYLHPALQDIHGSLCTVSFVLAWLIASTLCLVTAPLVEPRYFIIPWVLWRQRLTIGADITAKPSSSPGGSKSRFLNKADSIILDKKMQMILETHWLIIVNIATGYLFLYKGFTWVQEPGNIQRFMW